MDGVFALGGEGQVKRRARTRYNIWGLGLALRKAGVMRTDEFQLSHYCQWRKSIRDTPLEEIYLRSLKKVRKEGFSYGAVSGSEIYKVLSESSDLSSEEQRVLGVEECYRYGKRNLDSLEFREIFSLMGFALHGKRVLEFSRELGECLSRTDLNIKTSEVKVVYPSVYVVLPEGIDFFIPTGAGPRRVEGIYVTVCRDPESDIVLADSGGETLVHEGQLIPRAPIEKIVGPGVVEAMVKDGLLDAESVRYGGLYTLFFCVVRDGVRKGYYDFTYHFFQYAFPPDSQACLVQDILAENEEKWGKRVRDDLREPLAHSSGLASLIFNLFMYMAQEKADIVVKENRRMVYLRSQRGLSWEDETSMLVKYAASGEFELVEVGFGFRKGSAGIGLGGTHASPAGHWRRGHWHRYWVGPKVPSGQKVKFRWIQPLYVQGREEDPRAKLVKVE